MDDLISRQAAIDALNNWSEHSMTDAEAWHIRQVIGDIKSMPSAQPGWIPCSERLPEEEKAYLVTFASGNVGMSSWHKDTFNRGFNRGFDAYLTGVTEDGECEYFGVVAWMEKPEPWKGEEHGTSRAVLSQKPVR